MAYLYFNANAEQTKPCTTPKVSALNFLKVTTATTLASLSSED